MQVSVRRFTHGQLNGGDTEAPDVCLEVVTALLDDFWAHPVGCANERVFLCHCGGQLAGHAKVGQLHISRGGEENIGGCRYIRQRQHEEEVGSGAGPAKQLIVQTDL